MFNHIKYLVMNDEMRKEKDLAWKSPCPHMVAPIKCFHVQNTPSHGKLVHIHEVEKLKTVIEKFFHTNFRPPVAWRGHEA